MKKHKLCRGFAVTFGALLFMAFVWPWQAQTEKQSSSESVSNQTQSEENLPAQTVVDSAETEDETQMAPNAEIFSSEDGDSSESQKAEEDNREAGLDPAVAENLRVLKTVNQMRSLSRANRVINISKIAAPKLAASARPMPRLPGTNVDVVKTQLQQVMRVNEVLRKNYQKHSSMIQKVREQAVVHEKIIQEMTPKKGSASKSSEKETEEEMQAGEPSSLRN